jgi:hypothetical protein
VLYPHDKVRATKWRRAQSVRSLTRRAVEVRRSNSRNTVSQTDNTDSSMMLATMLLAAGALAVPHQGAALPMPDMSDSLDASQLAENTASGDEHHLWFYWVNPHPTGFGAPKTGPWCGEIDAARLVPDALFQSPLRLYLYEQATISTYSVPGGPQAGDLKVGRCQDNGFAMRRSLVNGAQWTPVSLQGPVCKHFCDCQWPGYAPAASLPVCKDVPDDPAKGEFCSLCGPNAPGNCGGGAGACSQGIQFYLPTGWAPPAPPAV